MGLIIKDYVIGDRLFGKNIVFGSDSEEEHLIIPNTAEGIIEQAFQRNLFIKVLEFEPGGNIIIGPEGFMSSSLEKITFSDSVVEIEGAAFMWCAGLKEVVFGSNLNRIGCNAFRDDKKISSLVLPDGLSVIDAQAFQGCKGLKKLVIPDSVTEIGNGAFNQCDKLEDIECSTKTFDLFFDSFNPKNKINLVVKYLSGEFRTVPEMGESMKLFVQKNQKKILDLAIAENNDAVVGSLISLPIKIDNKYIGSIYDKTPLPIKSILMDYIEHKTKK